MPNQIELHLYKSHELFFKISTEPLKIDFETFELY